MRRSWSRRFARSVRMNTSRCALLPPIRRRFRSVPSLHFGNFEPVASEGYARQARDRPFCHATDRHRPARLRGDFATRRCADDKSPAATRPAEDAAKTKRRGMCRPDARARNSASSAHRSAHSRRHYPAQTPQHRDCIGDVAKIVGSEHRLISVVDVERSDQVRPSLGGTAPDATPYWKREIVASGTIGARRSSNSIPQSSFPCIS